MSGSPATLAAPDLPAGPRLALVVATTTYADPTLRELRAPATDARDFVEVLSDPDIGGFEVTSVIDQPAQDLRIAVEEFLGHRAPGDFVVLYVSCHGVKDARNRLYFTACDTTKDHLASTGVPSDWVRELLDECRARSQVIILDCCFSGAFAHGAKGVCEAVDLEAEARGRAVLTASRATEYSFEAGAGTDITEESAHAGSVFTTALLEGLRTGVADTTGDGHITVDEAYAYAEQRVRANGAAQTPQRYLSGAEGSLVLARNAAGIPLTAAPLPPSLQAALDNPRPLVRQGAVAELGTWLTCDDPARVLTAERVLQEVADNDVLLVRTAAETLLCASPRTTSPDASRRGDAGVDVETASPSGERSAGSGRTLTHDGPVGAPARDVAAKRALLVQLDTAMQQLVLRSGGVAKERSEPDRSTEADFQGTPRRAPHPQTPPPEQLIRIRNGHIMSVRGVAFSPDGCLLASASDDKTVRLWDPATGGLLRTLTGHARAVVGVAFSPDGHLLATASADKTVRLWNPATGEHVRTLTTEWVKGVASRLWEFIDTGDVCTSSSHTDPVNAVAFGPDGSCLASAGDDAAVRLWDPATGGLLRTLTGHAGSVMGVSFSPDGRLLASAGSDKTVRLWDPATGDRIRTFSGHTNWVRGVAFSPDGRLLASASDDKTVRLWDPATGDRIRTFSGHIMSVRGVAFSPDGRLLASASDDKTVRLWDPATGDHIRTLTGHGGLVYGVNGVAFSPDGRLLASAGTDKTVRLWGKRSSDSFGRDPGANEPRPLPA